MTHKSLQNYSSHQQVVEGVRQKLKSLLKEVPALTDIDAVDVSNENRFEFDIIVKIKLPDQTLIEIFCEVKSKGEPAIIRKSIDTIQHVCESCDNYRSSNSYYMIGAPFISESTRKICEDSGLGYIDLSGNSLIKHSTLLIRTVGKEEDRVNRRRANVSVFERSSVKSSIILRHLLVNPKREWLLKNLAKKSGASPAQVSKVKKFLADKGLVANGADGLFVKEPSEIIIQWAEAYNKIQNAVYECYSIDSISEIERKLGELYSDFGIQCALTGFSGGARYAPSVKYKKVHAYVPQEHIDFVKKYLKCTDTSRGANVSLIVPYDNALWIDEREIRENLVVSPVQVCLDLYALKGRGEEAAEAIILKEFKQYER